MVGYVSNFYRCIRCSMCQNGDFWHSLAHLLLSQFTEFRQVRWYRFIYRENQNLLDTNSYYSPICGIIVKNIHTKREPKSLVASRDHLATTSGYRRAFANIYKSGILVKLNTKVTHLSS